MVRMFVRVDDIADRLVGDAADRQQQSPADADAAAGIDHGNGVPPDDDAEIGDVAGVVGRGQRDLAEMHVIAVRHLLRSARGAVPPASAAPRRARHRQQTGDEPMPAHNCCPVRRNPTRRISDRRDLPACTAWHKVTVGSGFDGCPQLGGWESSVGEFADVRSHDSGTDGPPARTRCRTCLFPSELDAFGGQAVGPSHRDGEATNGRNQCDVRSAGFWLTAGTLLSSGNW